MRLIRLPVCKSIMGKRVNICLVFLINIALLAGVTSSSALDKSTELKPSTSSKIIASAYYEPFTLYKGNSIYKSIYNQYDSSSGSLGILQARDDFSYILIDFVDTDVYSPYGQTVVRMESRYSQSQNEDNRLTIISEATKALNWINSLSCKYSVMLGNLSIPVQQSIFDLDEWQEKLNYRDSRFRSLETLSFARSSGQNGPGDFGSENWFENGVSIWLLKDSLETPNDSISYNIKIDKKLLPSYFGNPGFDTLTASLNCSNNSDLKWRLDISKKIKVNILPSQAGVNINVDYKKAVDLMEKAVAINARSNSDAVIQIASETPTICVSIGTGVILKKAGLCKLRVFQNKTIEFAAAERILEFSITSTITCVKGKLTKKVTAIKPVCPAGYKKK